MALTEVDVARLNDDVFAATGTNKNRIINGDMRIDQRNAGASVTIGATTVTYTLDRWAAYCQQASKVSIQQSTTAPSGFTNSLLVTSLAATTPSSGDPYVLFQKVEGFNWSDLGFGTASPSSATVSFWVRSSLTGTFGGVLKNNAETYSYPFSYTISAANTWEYKTVTIAGTANGVWATNNAASAIIAFDLGSGTSLKGTAGTWSNSALNAPTGSVNLIGTNGATFYITGIQLEAGDTATPFERRNYGQELALCQRYCPVFDASISFNGTAAPVGSAFANSTTSAACVFSLPTQTRVPPTGITVSAGSHFAFSNGVGSFGGGTLTFSFGSCYAASVGLTASSGTVTAATGGYLYAVNSAGKIIFNGCEL